MPPVLIFDGNCGFCRYWVSQWKEKLGERVSFVASQDLREIPPGVSVDDFKHTVVFVDQKGGVFRGAEAVYRLLDLAPGPGHHWPLKFYRSVPGFASLSELAYKVVAHHRPFFSKVTRPFR